MTILGLVAGALTTGCWLPQLLRSWRTRSAGDISWTYLGVLGLGVTLWLSYGLLTDEMTIILANGATVGAIIVLADLKASFDCEARETA
ncbi:SemiSWEET family sugar transporter [Protofrankia symbiont of Coriaria ruscifolia]|uniref:SemiSWEET family sugar transporter n=1 Tax=Protofrankia symbiont of Coriaria ruscifolia TaxID=1306542 RepID=UPI001041916F|nr:SemiSWEET family transporter [Protofrankia symbiont of Coriaria ruscifolia]